MTHSSRSPHIPALDGLRGVAILLVLAHHFTLYGGLKPGILLDRIFYAVTMAGWFGVDLFFVLSGFLITGILCDARGTRSFFRNFYVRRSLRIFPLYYGVLTLVFVVAPLLVDKAAAGPAYQQALADQSWYWTYLLNVKIALDGWQDFALLGHFWSLAVEEQFYLVWPFCVFLLSRNKLIKLCIGCAMLSLALRLALAWYEQPLAAYVLAPARMDALAVGGLLALLAREPGGLLKWRRTAWLVAGSGAAILGAIFVWSGGGLWTSDPLVFTLGYSVLACLFGATLILVVTSAMESRLSRVSCSRFLVYFGRYSYGLYVFHHPVLLVQRKFLAAPDLPTVLGSQLPGLAVFAMAAMGASLGIALLSWHWYEAPFLRLKERFTPGTAIRRVAPVPISS